MLFAYFHTWSGPRHCVYRASHVSKDTYAALQQPIYAPRLLMELDQIRITQYACGLVSFLSPIPRHPIITHIKYWLIINDTNIISCCRNSAKNQISDLIKTLQYLHLGRMPPSWSWYRWANIKAGWRIYASLTYIIIGSHNGLLPVRHQAIIWSNALLLSTGPIWTKFSGIVFESQIFSFKKIYLKMSFVKCRPFCLGLNVLKRGARTCLSNNTDARIEAHFVNYIILPNVIHF